MKKVSLLLIFLTIGVSVFAQNSDQYETAMKKNISVLDTTENLFALETVANNFERIASVSKDQWLPYYYASLARVRTAFMHQDKSKIDPIVDEAKALAEKANGLHPDKTEMLCLRSMIASARIAVDPQTRGMQYGPKAGQLLQQAEQLSPDNPRVMLLLGQNAFYTPAQWGGGKDKAKPLLQKALQEFSTFKPATDLSPNWGKGLAEYLLSECNK
ncbi:MAG: hypothetical protein ACRDE2_03120 [Chitinophagaceae bacterium]